MRKLAIALSLLLLVACDPFAPDPTYTTKDLPEPAVTLTARNGTMFSYRAEEVDEASCPLSVDVDETTMPERSPRPEIGKEIALVITDGEPLLEAENVSGEVWIEIRAEPGDEFIIGTKDGHTTLEKWCGKKLPPPPPQ